MSELLKGFTSFGDRYEIDAKLTTSKGWYQVDTWQDAPYFGVWVNPFQREIFTHCEGDRTLERCDDDADFAKALHDCLTFYDSQRMTTKIDCLFDAEKDGRIFDRFRELGFADRCH